MNNNDQNKFIVDNLMVKDESMGKKEVIVESEEVEEKNPYILDPTDEKYFKLFIGENYDYITKKKFNQSALLFCGVYLLYRKEYILGITWIILNLIFLVLLPILKVNFIIVLIILLISHICCGMFANHSYLTYVGAKIVEYKEKDPKNLKRNLINNGGTCFMVAFIPGIILLVLYTFFIYMNLSPLLKSDEVTPSPTTNDVKPVSNKFKYDGVLKIKTDTIISNDFNLPLLDGYQNISNDYSYKYLDGENDILPNCMIELMELDYNVSSSEFITGLANYNNELHENITKYEGILTWDQLKVIDKTRETIYNVTKKNDKLYLYRVTYIISNKDTCTSHYQSILNTLE